MEEHPIIVFMAMLIFGYGLFSKKAENSIITAPMIFVVIGLLVSFFSLELLEEGPKAYFVKPLMEFTLLLVLFIDGSTIDLKTLTKEKALPIRLLGIGLPITMVLGALLAIPLFPGSKTIDFDPDGIYPFPNRCSPRTGSGDRRASS